MPENWPDDSPTYSLKHYSMYFTPLRKKKKTGHWFPLLTIEFASPKVDADARECERGKKTIFTPKRTHRRVHPSTKKKTPRSYKDSAGVKFRLDRLLIVRTVMGLIGAVAGLNTAARSVGKLPAMLFHPLHFKMAFTTRRQRVKLPSITPQVNLTHFNANAM